MSGADRRWIASRFFSTWRKIFTKCIRQPARCVVAALFVAMLTGKYTLGFAATARFSRSAYGIHALGALVADEIYLVVNGKFQANER